MAEQTYNKTIVFGSAARWTPEVLITPASWDSGFQGVGQKTPPVFGPNPEPQPGDIDVLNASGAWTPEREAAVRRWAKSRGLGDLSLDIHEGDKVPTIFGLEEVVWVSGPDQLPMSRISGDGEVEHLIEDGWSVAIAERRDTMDHQTFPAAVRAAGRTGRPLTDFLAIGGQAVCLSLLPAGEEGYNDGVGPRSDWDKYTQGLKALRSAAQHAPEGWLEQTNCPQLLARLLAEEPVNWKAGPYWGKDFPHLGEGWSSAYTLVVGKPGDQLHFTGYAGKRTEVTEDEAIRLIFG